MQTVDTEQLQRMRERSDDLTVINVLDNEVFRKEHIPGSVNVPGDEDDLPEKVRGKTGGDDRPVVVYCASDDCDASPKAAKRLEESGFSAVYDYTGGMRAWKEAGLPVERDWS